MQFIIVSLAFLGMTSGAIIYTNELVQPAVVLPAAVPAISPEAQAVGDSIKCNLKALSESACKLAEGINCKLLCSLFSLKTILENFT